MSMKPIGLAAAVWLALGAAPQDPLVRARQLYNEHQYEAAAVAAREASRVPELADVAAVVLARAHLECYRASGEAADLLAARQALVAADSRRLAPRDRHDLLVGYGELLYFDGHYGAAAEMFGAALSSAGQAAPADRDLVLDWWAAALDREAQLTTGADRERLYRRVIDRMEPAAEADPPSAAALYWLAAAAAGAGDAGRAWHAAVSGWIRAPLAVGPRATLRADLERLVQQAIIPLRARLPTAGGDARQAAAAMQRDWEAIKEIGIRR
ncbi:MAG TPA: hypothetical protein PLN93_06330 [Vicinamibacterales bacterium]|nr:hypothetical protein [Vicinamibacterales bacterium]HOQ59261.1 hypothetical protein [Vicinamibacterales bacterium]HPK71538.1 hypothetical protein [Vicinamibacterales bacterium]